MSKLAYDIRIVDGQGVSVVQVPWDNDIHTKGVGYAMRCPGCGSIYTTHSELCHRLPANDKPELIENHWGYLCHSCGLCYSFRDSVLEYGIMSQEEWERITFPERFKQTRQRPSDALPPELDFLEELL